MLDKYSSVLLAVNDNNRDHIELLALDWTNTDTTCFLQLLINEFINPSIKLQFEIGSLIQDIISTTGRPLSVRNILLRYGDI